MGHRYFSGASGRLSPTALASQCEQLAETLAAMRANATRAMHG
jgi:hypothetical protein